MKRGEEQQITKPTHCQDFFPIRIITHLEEQWKLGKGMGRERRGEKKRKSARALMLEKGKKKANLTDGDFPP